MFRNYLKIAWLNIVKNKVYSILNILGLATGMAVALLIGLWVLNESSYDRFLPGYSQLYQVRRNFNSNGDTLTFSSTSLKLADALRNNIPEIKHVAEANWPRSHGLLVGGTKLYLSGFEVAGDFLKMFRFPFTYGNSENALKEPNSIVLTESTAKALFGTTNVLNQIVNIDNKDELRVSAVLKDLPENSSFKFKYLIPFSYIEHTQAWIKAARSGSFGDNAFEQYVELKPGVSYSEVKSKIRNIEKSEKTNVNARNSEVILQPIQDWHLFSDYKKGKATDGLIQYIRIFSLIGALVLLIACINFINLSTARSEKRAREVGVRKAIGSRRMDLILQFLTESALFTFISFFLALIFVQLALPAFNSLTGTQVFIPYLNLNFWLMMILYVTIISLLAGSRPAFYLSSFNPVQVLKGKLQVGKSATLSRKILVVIQFSCSIALIISTVIIHNQIEFAKDRPSGYQIKHLMTTDLNSDLSHNYKALKNELLQSRMVQSVTTASSPATAVDSHFNLDHWPGKFPGETVEMGLIYISDDYFKTLGMTILSGRNFRANSKADSTDMIFNEAAIKRMRLKNPLTELVIQNNKRYRIIGIVKDALMDSPYKPADPTAFVYGEGSNLIYSLSPGLNTHTAVASMARIFNKYNPAYPYDFKFVDEVYNTKFSNEQLVGKLAGIFASLAILISCLGLFGLAAFIAEQRTKEIGVRKVLGASINQIWMLLSQEFLTLVGISCIIASPIAYYFLQNWLLKYEYHLKIGIWPFLASALLVFLITLITISFQAFKAAISNPVKSLRSE